jgi:peptide/nickel transport system permease protein
MRIRNLRAREVVPIAIVVVYALVAIAAPLLAPHDPNQSTLLSRLAPPWSHRDGQLFVLGTDPLGRDILSRVIYGARISLAVAVSTVIVSAVIGVILGVLAGWIRGVVSVIILRLADIVMSVPFFLLAILVIAVRGPGLANVVLCLAITRWPRYTRMTYATVLETRERGFVRGAFALGATSRWIVLRHVVPEVVPLTVVIATLEVGLMVMLEASLSFIGLGVQPPTASWGSMLSDGREYVASAWWLATIPGLALFGLILAVNLLGDAVRDRLDPTRKVPRGQGLRRRSKAAALQQKESTDA